jgi:hypothetical protein
MTNFCCLPLSDRQVAQKAIVQAANAKKSAPKRRKQQYKKRYFHVLITGRKSGELCLQSFLNLFQIGSDKWKRLREDVGNNNNVSEPIYHGNMKHTNRTQQQQKHNAEAYVIEFCEITKRMREPHHVTRFIRHITGRGIRNTELDIAELPSSYNNKRRLFVISGVVVEPTSRGVLSGSLLY